MEQNLKKLEQNTWESYFEGKKFYMKNARRKKYFSTRYKGEYFDEQ